MTTGLTVRIAAWAEALGRPSRPSRSCHREYQAWKSGPRYPSPAAGVVDRAEHRARVVGTHERARAVVDRLPGDRHVVGVHHPVDEPDQLPQGDERGLAVRDRTEEPQVLSRGAGKFRIVAVDRVV